MLNVKTQKWMTVLNKPVVCRDLNSRRDRSATTCLHASAHVQITDHNPKALIKQKFLNIVPDTNCKQYIIFFLNKTKKN